MEFSVVHCTANKHQAANALWWLYTTGEHCTPKNDALPVMLIVPSPKENKNYVPKLQTSLTTTSILTSASYLQDNPPCAVVTSKPMKTATAPTLTKQLAELTQDKICRRVTTSVEIPASCYTCDRHGILARTAPCNGAAQSVVSKLLRPPPWPPSLLETGGTPWRAWHLPHHETWDILAAHGQWHLQDCWPLPRLSEKPGLPQRKTPPQNVPGQLALGIYRHWYIGPVVKKKTRNQFNIVISDRCPKLTMAILSSKF